MEKLQQLNSRINMHKEILDTMPKNNQKNIKEYGKIIEKIKMEFDEYQNEILNEIERRLKKIKNIRKNPEIDELKKKVDNSEGVLYLVNPFDTAYQKMDLDRAMFNLSHYYKKKLEVVNEIIYYCIKKFEEAGIELELKDFDYSEYVKEYFIIFFREMEKENVNSEKIKNKFEEIYWKCPEIIIHIELNFRYLYLKNEKKIDKYFENQKQGLLRNFSAEDIIKRFEDLEKELNKKIKEDKAILTEKLLEGQINLKDYVSSAIVENYTRFISKETLEEADENRMNEIDSNICKLINSVYEYKKYLQFKFIVDDIKRIYNERANHKNVFVQTKKEVLKNENKRITLNKKINKKGNEKIIEQRNNIIMELKQQYKELDTNEILDKVATELNDESTINNALYLASSFYSYVFTCAYQNNKEITEEEIDELVKELREFVKYPYKTIVNNVRMIDDRDILLMIKDRYQLLNMNIDKEDLAQENLDSLIENATKIETLHNIRMNKIDLEEIESACEFKKILNK